MTSHRPRILLLAMYPLDRGLWGATTRITQMRDALARLADLTVVSGRRGQRGLSLARFILRGRLRGLDGIYVENSTSLPGPVDLAFLACARAYGVPVLTYVRDAQQLFPEYYRADSLKKRASRAAFLPLTRLLMAMSTRVAFPSSGLAEAVSGRTDGTLLPPGTHVLEPPPAAPSPDARSLLFVGGLRLAAHGADVLLQGMALARERGHMVELLSVTRPGDEPDGELPSWVQLIRAEAGEIHRLLPQVIATITPRRKTPYNDLAVPIKVMEYLGYGRPMIVTDTYETARIVRAAQAGVVVPDTAEGIADGIAQVMTADAAQRSRWRQAALAAAIENSWGTRAATVLQLLATPP